MNKEPKNLDPNIGIALAVALAVLAILIVKYFLL